MTGAAISRDFVQRAALCLACVAFATAVSSCSVIRADKGAPEPTGSVTGVITGPSGPIGGANIQVTPSNSIIVTGGTDRNGVYLISRLPAGPAVMTVTASGYQSQTTTLTIPAPPNDQVRQDVSLNPR